MSSSEALSAAGKLLSGPRGRALCWTVLRGTPGMDRLRDLAKSGDLSEALGELAARVSATDLAALAAATDELTLFGDLADVVGRAVYWQRPFDAATDHALSGEDVRAALLPVAEAITASPGTRWWTSPVSRDRQRYVQFLDAQVLPAPQLSGAAEMLATWRADTMADERLARNRPKDPSAPFGGPWWSTPALSRAPSSLPVTTRALLRLAAARLALVEDAQGWGLARCWPLVPGDGARVYEIHGPRQWTELVGRYPLDVSRSRRHDWWRVTGWAGRWLIPDYTAVAADYDAVHVSVAGYLATAGFALQVGDARTMLAGWDPDATYWLTDVLSPGGPALVWKADERGSHGWLPVREAPG